MAVPLPANPGISQTNYLFFMVFVLYLIFITLNGDLAKWLGVFGVGSAGAGATATSGGATVGGAGATASGGAAISDIGDPASSGPSALTVASSTASLAALALA